nr:MAG TPA_asm: hypothetical protein [Bacteriophage sp.]
MLHQLRQNECMIQSPNKTILRQTKLYHQNIVHQSTMRLYFLKEILSMSMMNSVHL